MSLLSSMSGVGLVLPGRLATIRNCHYGLTLTKSLKLGGQQHKSLLLLQPPPLLQVQALVGYSVWRRDDDHRYDDYQQRGGGRNYFNFESLVNNNSDSVIIRSIHYSPSSQAESEKTNKPCSKVEQTVKIIEDEMEQKTKEGVVVAKKRPLWKRAKDEILHIYHGFRLLLIDTRISIRLVFRILRGKSLSRREHKQLVRTTSDLFRLVPFSVFIIIPFMELLLPLFIKMFPNMLPSTFQTKKDRESKMKAELKVKLEMAKFLQQTLDDMAPQSKGRSSQRAKEFAQFIEKIRKSGTEATTDEILKFCKLFEDEITLDSLTRPQLLALCRVLEIPALGTTNMVRFQLRMRLRNLKADDKVIESEGVDSMNLTELQSACKQRGMRAVGVPEDRLRRQLRQWLTLSLHEKVPSSLLLLTRSLYLPENLPATKKLQVTLKALPDSTTLSTKAAIGEREGKIDNKTRLELIKNEEQKIQEERQEARNEAKIKEQQAAEARKGVEQIAIMKGGEFAGSGNTDSSTVPDHHSLGSSFYTPETDDHTVVGVINRSLFRKTPNVPDEDTITSDDFDAIEGVIDKLGKDTKLVIEREEIKDLKAEISDYIEDVNELQAIAAQAQDMKIKVRESKGARLLFNRLSTMVGKLDEAVSNADATDRKAHIKNSLVATEELMCAIRTLKDIKDPAKLERIAAVLAKLDDDRDGKIEVDDLVKVIDVVGKEHINLSSKQLEEVVKMLAKEELLQEKTNAKRSAESVAARNPEV